MDKHATATDGLAELAAALDESPNRYDRIVAAFRRMPTLAPPMAPDNLAHAFQLAYRVLGLPEGGAAMNLVQGATSWEAKHLIACALHLVERALHDDSCLYAGRAGTVQGYAGLDPATARQLLAPYLAHTAAMVEREPTAHFELGWRAIRAGRKPFAGVVLDWIAALDGRGIGMPGTRSALADADTLDRDPPLDTFGEEGPFLIDLLADPHVLRVSAAARRLGTFYGASGEEGDRAAPSLVAILQHLAALPRYRSSACGAFVAGFVELGGLEELFGDARLPADFDREAFVLDAFALGGREPYLPNAQSFWFYVHEHYDFDGPFVGRLIDAGHLYVALMCATEQNQKVEGMQSVLERLTRSDDPWIAAQAAHHLRAFYS